MKKSFLFLVLLLIFSVATADYFNRYNQQQDSQAILLEQVKAITLETGKFTNGRKPIPQLKCVGGSADSERSLYPDVVQCVNVGSDSNGVPQWRCEADLHTSVRFGKTRVSCEGYSNPDDPYIWRGSCGLEYTLEYTQEGKNQKSGNDYYSYRDANSHYSHASSYSSQSSSFGSFIMLIIVMVIVFGIIHQLRSNYQNYPSNPIPPTPSNYGGYYPPRNSYDPYYGGSSYYGGYRPGFWSGFGGGSLLGYLFGRNSYAPNYGRPYAPTYTAPAHHHSSPSSSPRGSTTRTATSYASTDRR